jgi:sulfide:quinone oxidoreductase
MITTNSATCHDGTPVSNPEAPAATHGVLIIGGGTGGISVAARLRIAAPQLDVGLVDPSDTHWYQPLWTLVGGGVCTKAESGRPQAGLIPDGVTWHKDRVEEIDPVNKTVKLSSGKRLGYEQLVVCPGIQLDWQKIKGLQGNLGKGGIVSNYSVDHVEETWQVLSSMTSGNAIFTFPSTPIKCAGAPQKIMYLADEALRRRGVRGQSPVMYVSATAGIFGVQRYAKSLAQIVARKEIETRFRQDLIEVRADRKEAVFRHLDTGAETVLPYGLLHVVPPMSAPDFLKRGPLVDAAGWVNVHKYSLQHVEYPDVWALGDASSLPTSRTGAAIRKQAPVLVENLLAVRAGGKPTASYDGYASCPLVTGYGKLILAEFGYDGKVMETFPFDQSQERFSLWALKVYGLPEMYWNGMLRGRM